MSEVWQCVADPYREIRGESGKAVLGMFGVSQVPNHAESLSGRAVKRTSSTRAENQSVRPSTFIARWKVSEKAGGQINISNELAIIYRKNTNSTSLGL